LKLRKQLVNATVKANNTANSSSFYLENESEIDLSDLIMIEQNSIGNTELLFDVSFIDSNINLEHYKYTWNLPHFTSDDQYLNGVNETKLRVRIGDLLIGVNKIIINVKNLNTGKNYSKAYDYNKGILPYGGECKNRT